MDLFLHLGVQHDFEFEIRVVEHRGEADELIEQLVDRTSFGRAAPAAVCTLENRRSRNRVDEQDLVVFEKAIELVAERTERTGLDLDERLGGEVLVADDVDHKPIARHLEYIAGSGVEPLERGVERTLVEGADASVEIEPVSHVRSCGCNDRSWPWALA